MKVAHVLADSVRGGAGKGVCNLHDGLRQLGVDSTIVTAYEPYKDVGLKRVVPYQWGKLGRVFRNLRLRIDAVTTRGFRRPRETISGNFIGSRLSKMALIQKADIVNLHWIAGGSISLQQLSRFKQPVVWTLRDMWPFTGGCHYTLGCEQYIDGCGECPLIPKVSGAWDRTAEACAGKRRATASAHLVFPVAISPWLAKEAERSRVFGDVKIRWIWNSIRLADYPKLDRAAARMALGLDPAKRYLLAGAIDLAATYKGGRLLKAALEHFYNDPKNQQIGLLVFGKGGRSLRGIAPDLHDFGYVESTARMNQLYCAADVFLAPSLQEAFGKTLAESLASGTPVVAFYGSAPEAMLQHQKTGFLAKPGDAKGFSYGISWLLVQSSADARRAQCIESAQVFCHLRGAEKYRSLYEEILW